MSASPIVSELNAAVLGVGVMGEILVNSLITAGVENIAVTVRREERGQELQERYPVRVVDSIEAVESADLIILAVKPQQFPALLNQIGEKVRPTATLVSLAAGITIDTIAGLVTPQVGIVRVMPNTPAVIGSGVFGVSAGPHTSPAALNLVSTVLASSGEVVVVPEELQSALTSVSGSGPAYLFYLAEAMIAGGVDGGLDEDTARKLTAKTLHGAAELLSQSPETPEELRRRVTSPGGTTAAATGTFDDNRVADAIRAGMAAARTRSDQLAEGSA